MSSLPTRAEALETLRKAGCPNSVVKHSLLVAEIAKEIASRIDPKVKVDRDLVEVGALLHDIGRSVTHDVKHGLIGAEILEKMRYPERLVRLVRNHVGAGIPREEAIRLGLPPIDHIPSTVEEKVVCYADKLACGSTRVTFEKALKGFAEDLGSNHPALARLRCLHEEIVELMEGASHGARPHREDTASKT